MCALFTTRSAIWSIGLPIVTAMFKEYLPLVFVCAIVDNLVIMPFGLCVMELGFTPESEPPSMASLVRAMYKVIKKCKYAACWFCHHYFVVVYLLY